MCDSRERAKAGSGEKLWAAGKLREYWELEEIVSNCSKFAARLFCRGFTDDGASYHFN
jgi:hypothetical protein